MIHCPSEGLGSVSELLGTLKHYLKNTAPCSVPSPTQDHLKGQCVEKRGDSVRS